MSTTAHVLENLDAGPGRYWRVELVANAAKDPIRVTLMEKLRIDVGRGVSTKLAYTRTLATPAKGEEAARRLLATVGGYKDLIGEYPLLADPITEGSE
jgi:hypothetical protein